MTTDATPIKLKLDMTPMELLCQILCDGHLPPDKAWSVMLALPLSPMELLMQVLGNYDYYVFKKAPTTQDDTGDPSQCLWTVNFLMGTYYDRNETLPATLVFRQRFSTFEALSLEIEVSPDFTVSWNREEGADIAEEDALGRLAMWIATMARQELVQVTSGPQWAGKSYGRTVRGG